MSVHQKLGIILENKVLRKSSLEKILSPQLIFLIEIFLIFYIENFTLKV